MHGNDLQRHIHGNANLLLILFLLLLLSLVFPVATVADGEFVAQFKLLVLIMPNGNLRGTTDSGFNPELIHTDKKVTTTRHVLLSSLHAMFLVAIAQLKMSLQFIIVGMMTHSFFCA